MLCFLLQPYCKFAHNGYSGIKHTSWDKKKRCAGALRLEPEYLNIYVLDIHGYTRTNISLNNWFNTINRRLISFFLYKKQIIVRIIKKTDKSEFSNMTDYRILFNHIRSRTILQMSLLNLYKLQNDAACR